MNYSLDKIQLYDELEKTYDFPIFIENEANLTALGNYSFSSPFNSLISLSIHSGIGIGIIEDGKLLFGKRGQAGELGHTILFPDGKLCPCGNRGCLEQYASDAILYQQIASMKNIDDVDVNAIIELLDNNDAETLAIIKENAKHLAVGISNIVMMYDPDVVMINSPVYTQKPELVSFIKENLNSRFLSTLDVVSSSLGDKATLLGGVSLVVQQFLNLKSLKFVQ